MNIFFKSSLKSLKVKVCMGSGNARGSMKYGFQKNGMDFPPDLAALIFDSLIDSD
jgi:hypothetical protein